MPSPLRVDRDACLASLAGAAERPGVCLRRLYPRRPGTPQSPLWLRTHGTLKAVAAVLPDDLTGSCARRHSRTLIQLKPLVRQPAG